jgi:hypothetical protein
MFWIAILSCYLSLPIYSDIVIINHETVSLGVSTVPAGNTIDQKHVPTAPPEGYIILPEKEKTVTIALVARQLLGGTWGTITPFNIGNKRYMARVEPHYHPLTGALPHGWHKGVTIFKEKAQNE